MLATQDTSDILYRVVVVYKTILSGIEWRIIYPIKSDVGSKYEEYKEQHLGELRKKEIKDLVMIIEKMNNKSKCFVEIKRENIL